MLCLEKEVEGGGVDNLRVFKLLTSYYFIKIFRCFEYQATYKISGFTCMVNTFYEPSIA